MAGHPPQGRPPTTPAARSPRRACKQSGQCWAPEPAQPRQQHVGSGPRQPARRTRSRRRGSACPQTPLTTAKGFPLPGDTLLPPPQRATPACKGTRCGAGAGSPGPQQPHPGHTGRGAPAAPPKGRAAGGGTASDTRRPSQRWQANTPRDSPHTHTPAPAGRGWRTLTALPEGGQLGEGKHPTPDAPHNGERRPPRGHPTATPTARNAGPQVRTP